MKIFVLVLIITIFVSIGWAEGGRKQRKQRNKRQSLSAASSLFFSNYNQLDGADAESYGTQLFTYLSQHLTETKRLQYNCKSIPLPKTVLNPKYFNPTFELQQTKLWLPPKEHMHVIQWSIAESYRNSLFMSSMLQDDNALFPPGWLYLYLTTAAQLHSLQMIGYNSHKSVKAVKLPFDSNEVLKVNWYTNGNFLKFDKPFALYATKPNFNDPRFVRVVDFGVGNYTQDYTGHAFIGSYMFDQQQYLLNTSYEFSNNWLRPSGTGGGQSLQQIQQQQQQQLSIQQQQLYNQQASQVYKIDFDFLVQNSVPITSWDPLLDNEKTNFNYRLQDYEMKLGFDQWYANTLAKNNEMYRRNNPSFLNPFALPNVRYIDSYKFAKVWWANETAFLSNKQDYVFRVKPEERYFKFIGAKSEGGTSNTAPYFWCVDPTSWLATVMTPIWATNDFDYKNKVFISYDKHRFAGLSEVVLNYEEVDINQCPGDRQMNAFSGTSMCDSTTQCLPLAGYGLNSGGYECNCGGGYRYPQNVEGPFRGRELVDQYRRSYPLCIKSEGLIQFPNWISKTDIGLGGQFRGTDYHYPYYYNSYQANPLNQLDYQMFQKKNDLVMNIDLEKAEKYDHLIFPLKDDSSSHRRKRFLDRRNPFEKLRDAIYSSTDLYRRQCYSMYQDIIRLFDDDERFVLNLRYHVNDAFRPQMAQAIRIAHILSSYLQLHIPVGTSSSAGTQYDTFNLFSNVVGTKMKQDPQLDERLVIAEIMSTLQAHFPMLEANVFFNGTEFTRQKLYSTQNTLAFGYSMIRTDSELLLNRSNDDSHLTKSWYQDAISRYTYAQKGTFGGAGAFQPEKENNFYMNPNNFDLNSLSYKIDRYSIEMALRKAFDGMSGTTNLPIKFYDAASSGVWYGPYYDCQKRTNKPESTIRMSYSVPIITSSTKPPVGFVSIMIGSDLKWWKINPCEASKGRNMFQGLHRCDLETTTCDYQDVPEYESGYYLASYRCMCKMNYEFPYMDTGVSYFEGATVEREYEKKLKGQTNVYDRLKCRSVLRSNRRDSDDSSLYKLYSTAPHTTPSTLSLISSTVILNLMLRRMTMM